jgi:hypothetical protein
VTMTRQVPAHARSHACTRTVHVANSHFRATNAYRAWCALQDEWMRTVFQPQQYAQAPHQPYQQPQQQQMPREGPHANDLYASTNSIGSDGALSVLSNADDFSFDPHVRALVLQPPMSGLQQCCNSCNEKKCGASCNRNRNRNRNASCTPRSPSQGEPIVCCKAQAKENPIHKSVRGLLHP